MEGLPVAEILRIASKHGATSVRVFGSRARGDNRPDSDLDLLVTVEPWVDLIDMAAMKRELSECLDLTADIATEAALHPHIKSRVLQEARALDGAA
ncbi:MAG TPA: nucleotidyltransferase family protein [Deinococcales bacterium]|nr:nucleotidyltransferase family protein [Deinococcales bacterium]